MGSTPGFQPTFCTACRPFRPPRPARRAKASPANATRAWHYPGGGRPAAGRAGDIAAAGQYRARKLVRGYLPDTRIAAPTPVCA